MSRLIGASALGAFHRLMRGPDSRNNPSVARRPGRRARNWRPIFPAAGVESGANGDRIPRRVEANYPRALSQPPGGRSRPALCRRHRSARARPVTRRMCNESRRRPRSLRGPLAKPGGCPRTFMAGPCRDATWKIILIRVNFDVDANVRGA